MKAFTLLKIWLILLAISFQAKSASREEINFFETKIRPILVQNCYKCHSKDSEKVKGGLLLDNAANTQKGGDSGPAVVPNDLDKSLLYKSIAYKDKDLQMPPSGKLSESVIKDFETWIKMGAPDPRSGTVQSASGKLDEIVKNHWSYQPIKKPIVPTNSLKWGNNEIDAFILKKQLENKLSPSLEADKKTLVRRVYYGGAALPAVAALAGAGVVLGSGGLVGRHARSAGSGFPHRVAVGGCARLRGGDLAGFRLPRREA